MAHTSAAFPRYKYACEYEARGARNVGCMDKKAPEPGNGVLVSGEYQQVIGSRHGLALLAAAAMEVQRPDSFVNLRKTTAEFGQELGAVLNAKGIVTVQHGPTCGLLEGAVAIPVGIAAGMSPETYGAAVQYNPGLTEDRHAETVAAMQRMRNAGLISTPEVAKAALATEEQPAPAPYVNLADNPAPQVHNVIDYRSGVTFSQTAAAEDGVAAYYTTAEVVDHVIKAAHGTAVGELHIPTFKDVMAVTLGDVATHHIRRLENGVFTPYPITAIGYEG